MVWLGFFKHRPLFLPLTNSILHSVRFAKCSERGRQTNNQTVQCYPLFIQASQPKVSIRIKLISKLLVLNQTQNMTKYFDGFWGKKRFHSNLVIRQICYKNIMRYVMRVLLSKTFYSLRIYSLVPFLKQFSNTSSKKIKPGKMPSCQSFTSACLSMRKKKFCQVLIL